MQGPRFVSLYLAENNLSGRTAHAVPVTARNGNSPAAASLQGEAAAGGKALPDSWWLKRASASQL